MREVRGDLRGVLERIAVAKTQDDLKAVIEQARLLPENERATARWSYAYAAAQLTEVAWPSA